MNTRLGHYEVLGPLGAGGMGEVYRARDVKLNRDVAIKVLPDSFAQDSERLARFHREAQMLASLNHPNIAHIHGLEESNGILGLVMELVDGPTLSERIAEGPLPPAEAIPIARQIAEALQAAHEQGIVHRDLKPANIKLREDGTVKVLDFGLAKLTAPETGIGRENVSQSPTITSPAVTLAGVILGTAAYMSPEQTKGRPADKRSDVWAFGAVLYEMLTARRAFDGEDVSETLANVLKSEPDWGNLPTQLSPQIANLVRRCLVKDRRQRLADIAVALFVLTDDVITAPVVGESATRPVPGWRRLIVPIGGAVVTGAIVGTVVWLKVRPDPPAVTRFVLSRSSATVLAVDNQSRDLMITPDGSRIVYKGGASDGTSRLLVQPLDKLEPTPLVLPGLPRAPFSSPDGQWIGYVDPSPIALKKVAATGGPALRICLLDGPSRGATWAGDGTIIFATSLTATGLQRVSSVGGEPTILTTPRPERGESDHLWPQLLPDGQAVLFTITAPSGGMDASQIAVLDLTKPNSTPKILIRGGSQAQYVGSGHLVYAAGGTLRAVGFDLARRETIGASVAAVQDVLTLPTGTAEFDIGREGTLVYVTGGGELNPPRTLVWVDRQGNEEPVPGTPIRSYVYPRLSPDGRRLALDIRDRDDRDIWVWDFASATLTRVSTDPGIDQSPEWMPDGRSVVFSAQVGGADGVWRQSADGTGSSVRLIPTSHSARTSAVSKDGTRVLLSQASADTGLDVVMLTLENPPRIQPLLRTPFVERNAELSPDEHWLAYESNESGQYQISVRPFPGVTEGRYQVSTAGGTQPHWARGGGELFYLAPDGALMSVRVSEGAAWKASVPTKVVTKQYFHGGGPNFSRTYDVSPDGKRFLMLKDKPSDQPAAPPKLVVVRNWLGELKRLVPAGL